MYAFDLFCIVFLPVSLWSRKKCRLKKSKYDTKSVKNEIEASAETDYNKGTFLIILRQKKEVLMAVAHITFFSNALSKTTSFVAVLPNDGMIFPGQKPSYMTENMRTLYLLHGAMGSETDYLTNTNIRELSDKYQLAVIMPAGDNSFYVDGGEGSMSNYGQFIGEELVEYTRRLFHLSDKREDTFIGGLSMGGYGAMRNGLKYADTFSKICAFSGAYIVFRIIDAGGIPFEDPFSGPIYQRRVFGDLTKLAESDMNPEQLYRQLKERGANIPKIFMTEGSEDFLLDLNHRMRDFLQSQGADLIYIEDSGQHDWAFWNKHLEEAVRWLIN